MAGAQQQLRRRPGAAEAVVDDAVHPVGQGGAVHHHHGRVSQGAEELLQLGQLGLGDVGAQEDHPVHLADELQRLGAVEVPGVEVAHLGAVAQLGGPGLHPLEHEGGKGGVLGDLDDAPGVADEADRPGRTGQDGVVQTAVAQLYRRLDHQRAGGLAHAGLAVEGQRYGGGGQIQFCGDLLCRDASHKPIPPLRSYPDYNVG